MKNYIFISVVLVLFVSCSSNENTAPSTPLADTVKVEVPKVELAYPVKHVDWEIGDFNNVKKIIGMYKNWDENKSVVITENFADTLRLHIPDFRGEIVIPNKDISKKLRENRDMFKSAVNDVISAVALRDKASGEDWVMVTTYSKWTEENGKKDSVLYHDDWRLVNGKVDLLLSFLKLPPKGFVNTKKVK